MATLHDPWKKRYVPIESKTSESSESTQPMEPRERLKCIYIHSWISYFFFAFIFICYNY